MEAFYGVVLFIVLIILIILLAKYNKIVKLKNNVKQSKSGIDVYLNQRFDLIPNLVECVKAYSKYENDVLANIVKLRTSYNTSKETDLKIANKLNNEMNKILAIVENYPELKASEQYLNLQRQLQKIESQLQAARRIYNMDVTKYNTEIESIPTNLIAMLFRFKQEALFQIEEYKRENINIGEK